MSTETTYAAALANLLSLGRITADEHETLSRMLTEDYVDSLHGESGDRGLFFPANSTEAAFARYWTDEHYSWEAMVDDIDDFDEASPILSADQDAYWTAALAIGEEESARDVLRRQLYEADSEDNQGVRQAACDAVEFSGLSGVALEAALAIASEDDIDIDIEEEEEE